MRKSKNHEYRQAYNAQAVVDAAGADLPGSSQTIGEPGCAPSPRGGCRPVDNQLGGGCSPHPKRGVYGVITEAEFADLQALAGRSPPAL